MAQRWLRRWLRALAERRAARLGSVAAVEGVGEVMRFCAEARGWTAAGRWVEARMEVAVQVLAVRREEEGGGARGGDGGGECGVRVWAEEVEGKGRWCEEELVEAGGGWRRQWGHRVAGHGWSSEGCCDRRGKRRRGRWR